MNYITCIISSHIILQSGSTPLHAAAASWWHIEPIIEILIKAGADVKATDEVSYYSIIV